MSDDGRVVDFDALRAVIGSGTSAIVDVKADLCRALAEVEWNASRPAVPVVAEAPIEKLLTPEEAGAIVGVGPKWILRHTAGLRFRRDLSRKVVRLEENGLRRWAANRR